MMINKNQIKENNAYKKLISLGYQIVMSEGYIPISMRKYEVLKDGKQVLEGGFLEFIKFADGR